MNEALIQSYTLPYVRIIKKILGEKGRIYLVTLEKKEYTLNEHNRQLLKESLSNEGIEWVSFNYYSFGLKAMLNMLKNIFVLCHLIYNKKIDKIHAWCTPAGALGWILSKFTGRKLIVDSYEPHAQSMVENGTWSQSGLSFRILFFLEKMQTKHAEVCIGLTEKTPDYARETYGVEVKRHFIKPACVDLSAFKMDLPKNYQLIDESGGSKKVIGLYAGKIGGIYLEQEIFDFFKACEDYWKENFKAVVLTSAPLSHVNSLIKNAGITHSVFVKEVSYQEIPAYMVLADFALNPVKPVPSKRYCTSIKDGEYWAMGLPVVIPPNISDDSSIIDTTNTGVVIREFSQDGYGEAIEQLDTLLQENQVDLKKRIRQLAEKHRSFSIAEKVYREIYG